jgi:DNA-directed RNA polymerase subunit N (RpoN/RPB10)
MPQLARDYVDTTNILFGLRVFVAKKDYALFRVMSDDLRDKHIDELDYTTTVLPLLKGWAKFRGLSYVPVKVFCGNYALNKFVTYRKKFPSSIMSTVAEDVDNEVLYSELSVARYCVVNGLEIEIAVAELKPLLSRHWLRRYEEDKRPIAEAMEILVDEFCAPNARNYDDITRTLICRKQKTSIRTIGISGRRF